MLWKTLDMMECATVVSSLGTLAIALSSLYQLRRNQRDTFHPIVSIEDVEQRNETTYLLSLRNYGTGPALNVCLGIQAQHAPSPVLTTKFQGNSRRLLHIATNETKEVEVVSSIAISTKATLVISYECIRQRHYQMTTPFCHLMHETLQESN